MKRILRTTVCVTATAVALASCGSANSLNKVNTRGDKPQKAVFTQTAQISQLDEVAACVRPYVQGMSVMLTQDKDTTGRTNSVADGATGDYIAEGNNLMFASDLLEKAGFTLKNGLNVAGDSVTRQMVDAVTLDKLKKKSGNSIPDLYLNFAALSLDWDKDFDGSVMIYGFGAYHAMQRATVAGGAWFSKTDGSLDMAGHGALSMSLFSTQGGGLVGKIIDTKLVTADIGGGVQQPMQRWTGEFLVNLTVAKAMTRIPGVPGTCRAKLDELVPTNTVSI